MIYKIKIKQQKQRKRDLFLFYSHLIEFSAFFRNRKSISMRSIHLFRLWSHSSIIGFIIVMLRHWGTIFHCYNWITQRRACSNTQIFGIPLIRFAPILFWVTLLIKLRCERIYLQECTTITFLIDYL